MKECNYINDNYDNYLKFNLRKIKFFRNVKKCIIVRKEEICRENRVPQFDFQKTLQNSAIERNF